jgi:hypothetical protein
MVRQGDDYRLIQLRSGAMFLATSSKPNANGMVDGKCENDVVLVFTRDLEERAEPLSPKGSRREVR